MICLVMELIAGKNSFPFENVFFSALVFLAMSFLFSYSIIVDLADVFTLASNGLRPVHNAAVEMSEKI